MTKDHPLSNGIRSGVQNSDVAHSQKFEEVPVLIVGGGPCGLLLAYLLSKLKVRSLIIERYPLRLSAPKAHALSPRSLEICRQFGLDTVALRNLGTSRADALWVNFITNLSGEKIGRLPYERMDTEVLSATPEMIHNIPQPVFEDFVHQHLEVDPLVEVRKSMSFSSCKQGNDFVITEIEDRAHGGSYHIKSRHVVACDGSRSKVRENLGIGSGGSDGYETMMTIHFNADLRPVLGERVGMLHWIMDPEVSGFIIGYDLSNNQVLICNFDPVKYPINVWNNELCRRTIIAAIGRDIPFDVLSFRPWTLSRKVANSYRQGNVFLAGDAAHSFPPTGGLGLNSGIADVHNIAFKLAAVHHQQAGDVLLESYEADRKHVAEINAEQSVKNGQKIFTFLKSMGATDPDVKKARANLYRTIRDPSEANMIEEQIEGQREHFDNLELHIGYVYGDKSYPANASTYSPKYCTGARLPHAWIHLHSSKNSFALPPIDVSYVAELTTAEISSMRYSTLDLCRFDAYTLIVGPSGSEDLILQLKESFAHNINVFRLHDDFDLIDYVIGKQWTESFALEVGGSVLVRPDQHILRVIDKTCKPEDVIKTMASYLGLTGYSN